VSVLHYATIVALAGMATIFLLIFLTAGMAQLLHVPVDYEYYDDYLRGQSVWDLAWDLADDSDLAWSRQGGFIVSFIFGFVAAAVGAGASWKMRKEGVTIGMGVVAFLAAAVGAGALHSYASLVFVVPAVAAVFVLVEILVRNTLSGAPAGAAAARPHPAWGGQAGPYEARPAYRPREPRAARPVEAAPASYSAPEPVAGQCPQCGEVNPSDARFCGRCGTGLS
jgi:hypothetical protein